MRPEMRATAIHNLVIYSTYHCYVARDACSVLHSALIHDEPLYAAALIQRLVQLGLSNDVVNMQNHMQQVLARSPSLAARHGI